MNEFLGRGWHEHSGEQDLEGYRNGYTPKRFKTRSEHLNVQRPRVRHNEAPFASKLLERLDDIEQGLKDLVRGDPCPWAFASGR